MAEEYRSDGLLKAPGAHKKTKRNPKGGGRPRTNDKYALEALERGENPNPHGKYVQMRKFEDKLAEVEATPISKPTRGMYSGEVNPDDYLDIYKKVQTKKYKGRPWTFPSAEALQEEVDNYFAYFIARRIPVTVSGLACWLGITIGTLKRWQRNQDTMPFYPVIEPAMAFIHMMTEQGALEGRIAAVPFIFLSKNYWGLNDTQELSISTSTSLTAEEKRKIIDNLPLGPKDVESGEFSL